MTNNKKANKKNRQPSKQSQEVIVFNLSHSPNNDICI